MATRRLFIAVLAATSIFTIPLATTGCGSSTDAPAATINGKWFGADPQSPDGDLTLTLTQDGTAIQGLAGVATFGASAATGTLVHGTLSLSWNAGGIGTIPFVFVGTFSGNQITGTITGYSFTGTQYTLVKQ